MPPKLTGAGAARGRARGKSDPIDALAVARAALREPDLSRPRPDEEPYRELKLLVDHRDELVDERRRAQQRLRWHLHQLDPTYAVPLRMLARSSHLERVGRWLARREQELQVRLARELVARCRSLDRAIAELDQELEQRDRRARAGAARAARLRRRSPLPSCSPRSARSIASKRRPARPPQRRRTARGELRPDPAAPPRPRRQPPTQRRALPDRDHPGPQPPPARAYLERKRAEGKSRREAIRCLKRLLVRAVFHTLKASPALT